MTDGLRFDIDLDRQEVTVHVTPENIATLRRALDDAEAGGKVFIGDRPLLIIRPVGYRTPTED